MKLKIFYNKNVHENAAYYYELAKESREKIAGLEKAIEETKEEMKHAQKPEEKKVRIKKEKEWFEKFHHALSSAGRLMIGGRNAQQNDTLVAKYMDDNDLFFHADVQGAATVILKDGVNASEDELSEAAQFAASLSRAWASAHSAVDAYAATKNQLTKHSTGEYVPKGAFIISGERKWFRKTSLALRIGKGEKGLTLVPASSKTKLENELVLLPSKTGKPKGALAKSLAKRFDVHPDQLLEILPNGMTKTSQKT